MRKFLVMFFVFLLASIFIGAVISDVEFVGLKYVNEKELVKLLEPYIDEEVPISQLYSEISAMKSLVEDTGFFSSVRVRLDEKDGNYIVIFVVKENPYIEKVDVKRDGPGLVDESLIASEVTLEEGTVLNTKLLEETIANIKKLYSDAGYFLVDVRPEFSATKLTINITEYALWDIELRSVEDERLPFDEIKKEFGFQTLKDYYKTWLIFRWFKDVKDSYPKLEDIQKMMTILSQKFYFNDVRLKPVPAPKDELKKFGVKEKAVNLVFYLSLKRIIDGDVKVDKVVVEGNRYIKTEEILKELDLTGKVVDNVALLKAAQKILELYNKKGYMMTWLDVRVDGNVVHFRLYEKHVGKVIYEFISGDGECKVEIARNTGEKKVYECDFNHTKEYLVNDLVTLNSGEPLTQSKLADVYGLLSRSNYFEKVDLLPLGTKDSTSVDLLIKLKEKEKKFQFMGAISWGPPPEGYQWYEGFGGQLSLSTTNPLGFGQSAGISLNLRFDVKSINLNYSIPRPFMLPMKVGLGAGLSYTTGATDTENDLTFNGNLYFSTLPIYNNTFSVYFNGSYSFSGVTQSGVGLIHNYDNRNSAMNPTKGSLFYERYEYGGLLSSDEKHYQKLYGGAQVYFPIYGRFYGALKGFAGTVLTSDSTEVVISPYPAESVRGQDVSGIYSYRLGIELRYSVYEYPIPVNVILFYDMGKGADNYENLIDFVYSTGIGLDIVLPMFGKIEIGYAYKYPENNFDLYFVFGAHLYGGMLQYGSLPFVGGR